jgi:hypothetical protein
VPNCNRCGIHITGDAVHQSRWNEPLCWICFDRDFFHCTDCGRTEYRGETPDDELCSTCYDRIRFWHPHDVTPAKTFKKTKTSRCFGLELETSECTDHVKLRNKTCFGVKEDGSVDGLEFYSPILSGDQGLAEVRKFCRLAKKHHFRVDDQCGYHLHIDMRGSTVTERKRIAYAYRLTFSLWQHLVREDRWENTYCEGPGYTPQELRDTHNFTTFERHQCRYQFVNLRAFHDHSTYELRGFQGTLDHHEICNWIKAHLYFVEFCKDASLARLDAMFGKG